MKILIVADDIENGKGGAEESLNSIIEYLKEDYQLDYLEQFSFKYFKLLSLFNFDYVINILRIRKKIMEFHPDVIITQLRISFPTIIYANAKKIPVINIIHDITNICPKYVDIVKYGKSCNNYLDKKNCFKCIKNWKNLRVEIGNRPEGWNKSKKAFISTWFYKFRYYLCKKNQKILMKSEFNFVPSKLIQDKILPIKSRIFNLNFFEQIDVKDVPLSSKNKIIYVVPEYNDAHKGTDFVLELADNIPNALFCIVGKSIGYEYFGKNLNTPHLGRLNKEKLYSLFKSAKLTIVPSFMTESFCRVVVESLLQGTPVICSDNVGVGYELLLKNENLNMLSINLELWKEKINVILEKNIRVSKEDIEKIKEKFSEKKSKEDLEFLIKMLYKKRGKKC